MTAKIWKPTQAECDLIKRAASLESNPGASVAQLRLEPLSRYNKVDESRPVSFNIALVSCLSDWQDTDLSDCDRWIDFRKGVELTADGRAVVDFVIRPRTENLARKLDDLLGNVIVYYANGQLMAVKGCHSTGHDYLPKLLEQATT